MTPLLRVDKRRKNESWFVTDHDGTITTWDQVQVAVLMDIRDELQRLNMLVRCANFTGMSMTLRAMHRALLARKRKRRRT